MASPSNLLSEIYLLTANEHPDPQPLDPKGILADTMGVVRETNALLWVYRGVVHELLDELQQIKENRESRLETLSQSEAARLIGNEPAGAGDGPRERSDTSQPRDLGVALSCF